MSGIFKSGQEKKNCCICQGRVREVYFEEGKIGILKKKGKKSGIIEISIYTLSDLDVLSNLIGSHYSPPTE